MGKRGPKQASAAQLAALAEGRKKKHEIARDTTANGGRDPAGVRWKKLMAGELTLHDLDDEEIRRRKVRAKDGTFSGTNYAMTGAWHDRFLSEQVRRAKRDIQGAATKAVDLLIQVIEDDEAFLGSRTDAAKFLLNHTLGRAPETVTVREENAWDTVIAQAIEDNREMDPVDP